MKVLLVDMCSEKNSLHKKEFVRPIKDIVKSSSYFYDIMHFKELTKEFLVNYDKIILCGVALKDFEYLKHENKFDWIKETKIPVFGICAGAQIIAKMFGAKLFENKEIGLVKVTQSNKNTILEKQPNEIYSLHKTAFTCPENFIVILENEIPQLIKHESKEIYACLFHPEVRNKKLLISFLSSN